MKDIFTVIVAIVQIIVSLGFIGVFIFAIYKDVKKRERENYAEWISSSLSILRCIECEFRRDCQEIITDSFSGRNIFGRIIIGNYRDKITILEKEYKDKLSDKIIEWENNSLSYSSITSVPKYLEMNYERNISEIADTFRHFGDFMTEQIKMK